MRITGRAVVVYGAAAGLGGLGTQSLNAVVGLGAAGFDVVALGPGLPGHALPSVSWSPVADGSTARWLRWSPYRWYTGALQFARDRRIGRRAAQRVARFRPALCYAFTQVALETLRWARARGVPAVLESPNGHIRHFREVYAAELARWCGARYRGHPTDAMVERVEEEYALADRIRVSSEWARRSLMVGGVPGHKIQVVQQPVDLARYAPTANRRAPAGPLRICFVGSLDLRKGFVYLLKALQQLPAGTVGLRMVGATGDRCSRHLLARESIGLDAVAAPGDPRPVYAASELLVLPTLEDGSPFAVAEAMASGLPVVTTSATGAAEWVREDVTGWVVPPADVRALSGRLLEAAARRCELRQMGCLARRDTERRAGRAAHDELRDWLLGLEI